MLTKRINALVVDDEKPSREALATYIRDFCPTVEIVAECDSVKTAFKAISDFRPQLVFLDIEMPNGNGFELLKLYKTLPFKVIFVTAYSDYAIRAFRFAAADYLLKPVKIDELVDAVARVQTSLESGIASPALQILQHEFHEPNGRHQNLVIADNKGYQVVKTNEIVMLEADGYCTHIYLTGNRKITSSKNLKHFEEIFENQHIARVHRSFLVNIDKVKGFTKQGEIRLEENLNCPLGNNYKQQFLEKLGG